MYIDILNCSKDHLSPRSLSKLANTISKHIAAKPPELNGKHLHGAFAVDGVETIQNGTLNLWCEFVAKKLNEGVYKTDVFHLLIYDEIPDIVLDRMNEHKRAEEKSKC